MLDALSSLDAMYCRKLSHCGHMLMESLHINVFWETKTQGICVPVEFIANLQENPATARQVPDGKILCSNGGTSERQVLNQWLSYGCRVNSGVGP